jgi:hypothetical protein
MSTTDERMRELAGERVRIGFQGRDEIVAEVTEMLEDETGESGLHWRVERETAAALERHRIEQATWTSETDCDRLERAFDELERSGIVARQDFTCCMSCGHSEIRDEMQEAAQAGPVQGYVFYHMQDTESAVASGGLYLAYGAARRNEAEAGNVGWRIVEALRRHGLRPEWTGDVHTRIGLTQFVWKKRRDD